MPIWPTPYNGIITKKNGDNDKEHYVINEGQKKLNKSEVPGRIYKCSRT